MKPEIQPPDFSVETNIQNPNLITDKLPEVVADFQGLEKSAEKKEQSADLKALASDVSAASSTPTTVSISSIKDNDDLSTSMTSPSSAGDDDLIEKEWVDRAKKIVNDTKNDPYKRDQDVNQLRSEYTRKRYGRESGASGVVAA